MPPYVHDLLSMVMGDRMLRYFEDQFAFYGILPNKVKLQTRIRLYQQDYGWNQIKRWEERFSDVCIDQGKLLLKLVVSRWRLFISTYNASTYSESLGANIPSVIYWDPIYWEYSEFVEPDFEELA